MNIALIAHDKKKADMINFAKSNESILSNHDLYATGTTGKKIMDNSNLKINCFLSGPLGGDQQIGALVATKKIDLVIFFRDPLTAQPHEPDVSALMRICDVHDVAIATNYETAKLIMLTLGDEKTLINKPRNKIKLFKD